MLESFHRLHQIHHTAAQQAVDLEALFILHGTQPNGYLSTHSSLITPNQRILNALSSLPFSLLLPLSLLPIIDLLLQHNTVHARLQQRAHQTRLPLQHP